MIDEKKLIEDLKEYAHLSAGDSVDTIKVIIKIVGEQPKVGDWIPAAEPPEDDDYILLSFENYSGLLIGRYDTDEEGNGAYYLGDCCKEDTCVANDLFVNAWQPLPEPYNPGEVRKQTNGDRIRAMSDEELAELLYSLQYGDEKVNFCGNNKECDDIMDGGGTIPDEMCKQCLVWWLQSEVEE